MSIDIDVHVTEAFEVSTPGQSKGGDLAVLESFSGSSVSVDIKAFKGKGAFRSLTQQISQCMEQVRAAMSEVSQDTVRLNAACYLRMLSEGRQGRITKSRLRWCVKGWPRYAVFDDLESALDGLPHCVVRHFTDCDRRATELNVLESVLRQALVQLETYLRHGALRQRKS